jgi:transposase
MNVTRLAVDLAKNVFQVYGVDAIQRGIFEKKVSRSKFFEQVAKLGPDEIVMEACGSANYWARLFQGKGYKVRLISPQYVKPYVKRNKNDMRDARAIMQASYAPDITSVTPKTLEQQDIQSVLRTRENLINMRTMASNQTRGLMSEYGVVVKAGYASLKRHLPEIYDRNYNNGLTATMKELLEQQYEILCQLDKSIKNLDVKVQQLSSSNPTCKRLQDIEGVGPITALAIIALVGDGVGFKNGRHFAAYLGLVPRQHSSGQRERLLGISKQGNKYLRELLVHGGRSVVRTVDKKSDARSQWIKQLKQRAGANKTAVAIANKNARIAMALILSGKQYKSQKAA